MRTFSDFPYAPLTAAIDDPSPTPRRVRHAPSPQITADTLPSPPISTQLMARFRELKQRLPNEAPPLPRQTRCQRLTTAAPELPMVAAEGPMPSVTVPDEGIAAPAGAAETIMADTAKAASRAPMRRAVIRRQYAPGGRSGERRS